jgi:hypothetical protein
MTCPAHGVFDAGPESCANKRASFDSRPGLSRIHFEVTVSPFTGAVTVIRALAA